jgi:hypothetical protein
VLALRRTCSLLASVGLDHFANDVTLVFNSDRFHELTKVEVHLKLSKHMCSLSCLSERFKVVGLEERNQGRPTRGHEK